MKKIKVLQINAYYGYGSTGNILQKIECEAQNNNLDVYAIYWLLPNPEIKSEHVFYCGNTNNKSSINKMIKWIFDGGKLNYNTQITKKIIETVKKINPDIIHLHNLHGDFEYGMLDLQLFFTELSKLNKKIIYTMHDCFPITGRCYYFSYKECDKWKTGCGKCPQRLYDREGVLYDYSQYNWKQKDRLYSNISDLTIVTVSNWLNSIVKESMLNNRNIITIYNGVNTEIYKPQMAKENRFNNDKFKILCIGWDRRKGYKDYFKLSKMLDENEEIIVVGKRPLFRKTRKLPKNIIEIPRANTQKEMSEIYSSVDVYFNSSPAETFGLTTVEAMSCGTPVIGYKNTATTELINHIKCGCVVKNKDLVSVYDAIKQIRNLKIDKEQSHIKCKKLFDDSIMMKKYINLYIEI